MGNELSWDLRKINNRDNGKGAQCGHGEVEDQQEPEPWIERHELENCSPPPKQHVKGPLGLVYKRHGVFASRSDSLQKTKKRTERDLSSNKLFEFRALVLAQYFVNRVCGRRNLCGSS